MDVNARRRYRCEGNETMNGWSDFVAVPGNEDKVDEDKKEALPKIFAV